MEASPPVSAGWLIRLRALTGELREFFPVAFFDAAHGPPQMIVCACPKCLRLAFQDLHHERVENADLLQCGHVATNVGERCVETVEEVVDEWFLCAVRISISHGSPF